MKMILQNKFCFLLYAFCSLIFASCSVNKAKIDNSLKKYFDSAKVEGCFTLLDNSNGQVTVYNMELDTTRFTPASTFKIITSLVGLQTGAITNDTMMIKWDGIVRTPITWNKDLGMKEAFKVSSVPYYQEVARRIGKDSLQKWLDSLGYGNKKIGGTRADTFWLDNSLKISPDEQLGLMKKIYFDQLPFRKSVHESVKQAMVQEENNLYKLSYKTGWGVDELEHNIGWLTGWVEENNHVYFFVTLIKAGAHTMDMPKVRMDITKGILKQLGFLEGRK
jgi:beta-lactamase class D